MIHIIIKDERREADEPIPADIAKRRSKVAVTSINADIRTPDGVDGQGNPKFIVMAMPPQLHTMAEEVTDFSNIAYAASWDGRSPWIEVLAGDIADIKLAHFGWPMITKEQWLILAAEQAQAGP